MVTDYHKFDLSDILAPRRATAGENLGIGNSIHCFQQDYITDKIQGIKTNHP
jgi:hypothetical protein